MNLRPLASPPCVLSLALALGAPLPACSSSGGSGPGGPVRTNVNGDGGPGAGDSGGGDGGSGLDGSASLTAASKLDILFDIDNSASMGDKQEYLKAAIPDLLGRLLNPNCVDATGASRGPSSAGTCPSGQKPEFAPVHDMHLGIVSSSLGKRGGDVCDPAALAQSPFHNISAHNDDQGHLLDRALAYGDGGASVTEGILADAPASDPFLYWFPSASNAGHAPGPGTPLGTAAALASDFTEMVGGVGVFGCGIESQLESWYRFLVQPDPYDSIAFSGSPAKAAWMGVDTTILRERRDFLRPDSAVLIVVLSDENDSEIDVRSVGGLGVNWMSSMFDPPRGTSACAQNPGSSMCQSCAQGNSSTTDPGCSSGPYSQLNDWGYDLNLRHVHMKAKYGIDPQFPIERYVVGLTSMSVPDRLGEYPAGSSSYVGMTDCVNPLFAASLPDGMTTDVASLCHLTPGPRSPGLVFYAHIGGVPSQLLHYKPGDPAFSAITDADWVKILGTAPEQYDYTGIDPHMIEQYQPRSGLAAPGSANDADPISGHEWVTNTSNGQPGSTYPGGHILAVDREYACIFPLSDAMGNPAPRDCTQPQNAYFCDCPRVAGSVTPAELPPVCNQTTITQQTGAKAYPTIRELLLAKKMGAQGIVSSICPIDAADNATHDDPLYGYRPAVDVIFQHLRTALAGP